MTIKQPNMASKNCCFSLKKKIANQFFFLCPLEARGVGGATAGQNCQGA